MKLTTEKLTVERVEAQIALLEQDSRKQLRHLRALLRVLKDEADNQQPSLFDAGTKQ